jgi:succinate dehydrogenase / fumarate reductase cytochrome b subunit
VGEPALPRNGLLWLIRIVLIAALVLHVIAVVQLAGRNYAARPAGHRFPARHEGTLASRTMLVSGLLVLAFLVFHILQFTTRTIQVTPVNEGTVYANLYMAFQKWYFVAIYVGIALLLAAHLWHGGWSTTQTWGLDKPNRNPTIRRASIVMSVLVAVGFASVPLAMWTGVLDEPPSLQARAER